MSRTAKLIHDFTRGPLLRQLILFSIPFMLSNALQVFYSLADILIVGQFVGSQGLASVYIASQIFVFITMLSLGFSTGGQVYISQLLGKGEKHLLNRAIGTLFSTQLGIGAIMTIGGLILSETILRILNTPDEAFQGALDYMIICSAGTIFCCGYNMISAVLRGMGNSRHPFLFILIASVLNVILDLWFIVGLHWGTAGAAAATVLSQGLSFGYALIFLHRHKEEFGFDFQLKSLKIDTDVFYALMKLGLPFATRFATINISMMFVTSLVNNLGYQAAATFGIGIRLDDLATKISQGVMLAASAMIGQNFSAGKFDRIRKTVHYSWLLSVGLYLIFGALLLIFPEEMFGFFTDDPEIFPLAIIFISAIIWHYPALVIMRGTNALIMGIGNPVLGLIFALFDGFFLRIACSWFLGIQLNLGLYGFILGYALATYGTALPGLFYFLFIPWYKRKAVTA